MWINIKAALIKDKSDIKFNLFVPGHGCRMRLKVCNCNLKIVEHDWEVVEHDWSTLEYDIGT